MEINRLFNEVFKDKTILVTGHTGFKGSWLSIWLLEMGAKVVGYSLDPYTPKDNFVLAKLSEKMVDIRADVRDFDKLKATFQIYQPEIVFHLAAQPLVRDSYEIPRETYETNVMGTVNVLECVRQTSSVKVCLVVTSDKCYENKEQIWGYRENDPMGGHDPYSSSKGCTELVVSAYRNSFFSQPDSKKSIPAIASARAGNVIGGGDWSKDRLIPDIIQAFETKKSVLIRNPKAVRPWQHVLEAINGYLLLSSRLLEDPKPYIGAWNFGPLADSVCTVEEVTTQITDLYDNGKIEYSRKKPDLHEAALLNLDISKAIYSLGWKPKFNIQEAIKFTVDWYKKYKKEDAYTLCIEHIKEFVNKKGKN